MAQAHNPQDTLTHEQNVNSMAYLDEEDVFDILISDETEEKDGESERIIEEYKEDFDGIQTNVDEEEMFEDEDEDDNNNDTIVPEQVLSQKLSQLSAKDERFGDEWFGDFDREDNDHDDAAKHGVETVPDNDQIPLYLQHSANDFFEKLLLHQSTTTVHDLRQFAILKHQMENIRFRQQLWTLFLKSGTGQWETQESCCHPITADRCLWPVYITKRILPPTASVLVTDDRYQVNEYEHQLCENIVRQQLEKFQQLTEQYQNELDRRKTMLPTEIADEIINYVQHHGIRSLQMAFNYKITLLECNYDAGIVEREFRRQFQPTQSQIDYIHHLLELRVQYVESLEKLIELKQRIRCNKPTKSMFPGSMISGDTMRQNQEKLTDSMIPTIVNAEDTIQECQQAFDDALLQFSTVINNDTDQQRRKLIDRHLNIIDRRVHLKYTFRMKSLLSNHSDHDSEEDENNQLIPLGFLPSLILHPDLSLPQQHQLTDEQLKLINRGPTYISPCQMYVTSSFVSIKDMLDKQFTLLKHYLSIVFAKYQLNPSQSIFIQREVKEAFMNSFSTLLPAPLHQRALHEKQLIRSIRQHLKRHQLILRRTANGQNIFYLCPQKDFQDKANEYMNKTDLFEVVLDLTNTTDDLTNLFQQTRDHLNAAVKSMNGEFQIIFNNKSKHRDCLNKLYMADTSKLQLPYLYFLPDISTSAKKQETTSLVLKPVIAAVSRRSITSRLALFLEQLLRPIIQRHARPTTFVNGADFMRKFHGYVEEKRLLRPTTLFATLKFPTYPTLVPHGQMLSSLRDFLDQTLAIAPAGVADLSINRIIHLTSLFLHNNRFYYENRIYRFTKGAPTAFPLTETLAKIYLYQWERTLFHELSRQNEFYGRHKDEIYLTWNGTVNAFHELFQSPAPEFPMEIKIDFKTQFLNVYLHNLDGQLYSCVYHDPKMPKCTLPYVIGDATVAHGHGLRSALIRAVRYCTCVCDFNNERIYLEVTYLANGYSLEFIEQRMQHFYMNFDATSLRSSLNQHVYDKLRHRLFNFISEQQQFANTNQELATNLQRIHLTYLYQYGPKHPFEKTLREILSKNLSAALSKLSSGKHKPVQIVLRSKQQYSLNALLSQQKPSHPLLNEKMFHF